MWQRYQAVQLLVETLSGRAFLMMDRTMQAKFLVQGASMGLGFGITGSTMNCAHTVRGIDATLSTSIDHEALDMAT
jgi:hypothetical protein